MILSFKTQWDNGYYTYFPEKIWNCFQKILGVNISLEWLDEMSMKGYKFNISVTDPPKLHTIRKDEKERWKAGVDIRFRIFNRSKNTVQFAPVIPCISTQKIEIDYKIDTHKTVASVLIDGILQGEAIWVNCQLVNSSATIDKISINDGFRNTNEFFEHFDQNFTGKIIHWTD